MPLRTLKLSLRRPFAWAHRRGARARASCIAALPRDHWDRVVLYIFICCLFSFLHALLGFGIVNEAGVHASNETMILARVTPHVASTPWTRGSRISDGGQEMEARTRAAARVPVMVDWHGNYELFPGTPSALAAPASVPQDGFPDPTPAVAGTKRGQAPDEGWLLG